MTLCVTLHCKKVTFVVLFNTGHCGVVLCFSLGLIEGCSRCFSQVRRRSAEWSTNQFSKVQTQKCCKEMLIVDTLSCNASFLLRHGPVERSWSRGWSFEGFKGLMNIILSSLFWFSLMRITLPIGCCSVFFYCLLVMYTHHAPN